MVKKRLSGEEATYNPREPGTELVIAFHGDLIIVFRKNLSQKGHIQLCIENFDNDILDIKQEGKFRRFQFADGCIGDMLIDTPLYEDAPIEKDLFRRFVSSSNSSLPSHEAGCDFQPD